MQALKLFSTLETPAVVNVQNTEVDYILDLLVYIILGTFAAVLVTDSKYLQSISLLHYIITRVSPSTNHKKCLHIFGLRTQLHLLMYNIHD